MRSLQWGRDLLIAEIYSPCEHKTQHHGLQWGRDLLIAEIWSRATTRTSLKTLQWGRDLLIAEMAFALSGAVWVNCGRKGEWVAKEWYRHRDTGPVYGL